MKTRPTVPKVAKEQLRVPLTEEEYRILEVKYSKKSEEYRDTKTINQYMAELFEEGIRPLQKEMDDTNQINLKINHSVYGKYSTYMYVYINISDMHSLEALANYIGYSRVNLFRYLILKRLYV